MVYCSIICGSVMGTEKGCEKGIIFSNRSVKFSAYCEGKREKR